MENISKKYTYTYNQVGCGYRLQLGHFLSTLVLFWKIQPRSRLWLSQYVKLGWCKPDQLIVTKLESQNNLCFLVVKAGIRAHKCMENPNTTLLDHETSKI